METALHAFGNYLYISIILYFTIKLSITTKTQKCYSQSDILITIFCFWRPLELQHNNIVLQKKVTVNITDHFRTLSLGPVIKKTGPIMGPYYHDLTNYRLNKIYFYRFQWGRLVKFCWITENRVRYLKQYLFLYYAQHFTLLLPIILISSTDGELITIRRFPDSLLLISDRVRLYLGYFNINVIWCI